jgi:hypothetical protein
VKRREFITLLAAQRSRGRLRQGPSSRNECGAFGVLMLTSSDEPESQTNIAAFLQGLQEAGWSVGRKGGSEVVGRPPIAPSAGETNL